MSDNVTSNGVFSGRAVSKQAISITLQSSVGGFSPEFMRQLPLVEQAMIARGLDPSEFVISKDNATRPMPWLDPFFYDYTVFIGDEHFTVTEPNDIRFLSFFFQRCVSEEALPEAIPSSAEPGLIRRFLAWMNGAI
jgi:hypothetical protein